MHCADCARVWLLCTEPYTACPGCSLSVQRVDKLDEKWVLQPSKAEEATKKCLGLRLRGRSYMALVDPHNYIS